VEERQDKYWREVCEKSTESGKVKRGVLLE